MSEYNVKERLQAFGVGKILNMIKTDPEKNIPRMMDWIDRFDVGDALVKQRTEVRKVLEDPENPWNKYIMSLWTDIDDDVRNFRTEKPLFTVDFWNDGEFVGGCIAGGARLHAHQREWRH